MRQTVKSAQCGNSTRKPSIHVSLIQLTFSELLSQIAAAGPPHSLARPRSVEEEPEAGSDCAGPGERKRESESRARVTWTSVLYPGHPTACVPLGKLGLSTLRVL